MTIILGTIGFILAITLMIAFHEFGHYWVAKKAGIKIICFSIGFGKPIYSRLFGKDDSSFVIGSLPLGGYVKMLDEREGPVDSSELHRAFSQKSLGIRTAVVAAGPLANFILAFLIYTLIFSFGTYDTRVVINEVIDGSPAMQAGLQRGDEIYAIDGKEVRGIKQTTFAIIESALDYNRIPVEVITESGVRRTATIEISGGDLLRDDGKPLHEALGIFLWKPKIPAVIAEVLPESAAERYGLQVNDLVTHFNGEEVSDWARLTELARAHPNQSVELWIERAGQPVQINLVTDAVETSEEVQVGKLGVSVQIPKDIERHQVHIWYSPLEAIGKAVEKTVAMTWLTFKFIWHMLTGNLSFTNISGPITIAEVAALSFLAGLISYLNVIALISISIGVINLLPIPILDGGHLFYYLIEFVSGRPLSATLQAKGQLVGIFLIGSLIVLALYNDIQRLLQ